MAQNHTKCRESSYVATCTTVVDLLDLVRRTCRKEERTSLGRAILQINSVRTYCYRYVHVPRYMYMLPVLYACTRLRTSPHVKASVLQSKLHDDQRNNEPACRTSQSQQMAGRGTSEISSQQFSSLPGQELTPPPATHPPGPAFSQTTSLDRPQHSGSRSPPFIGE